jgi:hypothetical protein
MVCSLRPHRGSGVIPIAEPEFINPSASNPPSPRPSPPLTRGERAGSGGILHAQQFVNFGRAIGIRGEGKESMRAPLTAHSSNLHLSGTPPSHTAGEGLGVRAKQHAPHAIASSATHAPNPIRQAAPRMRADYTPPSGTIPHREIRSRYRGRNGRGRSGTAAGAGGAPIPCAQSAPAGVGTVSGYGTALLWRARARGTPATRLVSGHRYRLLLGGQRTQQGVRAPRRASRRGRHRQLVRVPHAARSAAGHPRNQPRRHRHAQGDYRQPELLDDYPADGAGAVASPVAHSADCGQHLSGGERRRRTRDARAAGRHPRVPERRAVHPDRAAAPLRLQPLLARLRHRRGRLQRRGAQGDSGDAQNLGRP